MTTLAHCVLEARMACLAEAMAFVEAFCQHHAIGHAATMRATFVVEELFTNTVRHGHGGDSAATIRLDLSLSATEIGLHCEDGAPPFDPRPRMAAVPPGLDGPIEKRPEGGLGLYLVGQHARRVRYRHEAGRNRLWVFLPRSGSGGG